MTLLRSWFLPPDQLSSIITAFTERVWIQFFSFNNDIDIRVLWVARLTWWPRWCHRRYCRGSWCSQKARKPTPSTASPERTGWWTQCYLSPVRWSTHQAGRKRHSESETREWLVHDCGRLHCCRNLVSFPPDCEHFKLIPTALGVKRFTEKHTVCVLTQKVSSAVLEFLETKYW